MRHIVRALILSALAFSAQASFGIDNALYGGLGFTEGGIGLGVDYEYTGKSDYGLGGYVRIYSKEDTAPKSTAPGIVTIGAFMRPHFNKKSWDMYLSPGFGLIQIDAINSAKGDATTFGPSFAIGLFYELTSSVSLGVENMRTWVWFDEDYRGLIVDDLAMRFRMTF